MNHSFESHVFNELIDLLHKYDMTDSLTNQTDLVLEVCSKLLYSLRRLEI